MNNFKKMLALGAIFALSGTLKAEKFIGNGFELDCSKDSSWNSDGYFYDSGQKISKQEIQFYGSPAVGDVNGDGYLDVCAGSLAINNGKANFTKSSFDFQECEYAKFAKVQGAGKLSFTVNINDKPNTDKTGIASVPHSLATFDENWMINVIMDGIEFPVSKANADYKFDAKKGIRIFKSKSGQSPKFLLKVDMTSKVWSFNVSKCDLSKIDSNDGVEIKFIAGDNYSRGMTIAPSRKTTLKYKQK